MLLQLLRVILSLRVATTILQQSRMSASRAPSCLFTLACDARVLEFIPESSKLFLLFVFLESLQGVQTSYRQACSAKLGCKWARCKTGLG